MIWLPDVCLENAMTVMLRPALPRDLDALFHLEQVAFSGDRFNRRQ